MTTKAGAFDRLRHWLIRKISCGDMVLLNFEIRTDDVFQAKNLGPSLVANIEIRSIEIPQYCIRYDVDPKMVTFMDRWKILPSRPCAFTDIRMIYAGPPAKGGITFFSNWEFPR